MQCSLLFYFGQIRKNRETLMKADDLSRLICRLKKQGVYVKIRTDLTK